MAYSEKVLDHYENPRNVGSFGKEAEDVGTGMVGAPACGDVMKLQIKVGKDGVIEDAKFKTYGCGSAIASSSLVTEWVKGKTLDQALDIKNTQIAERRRVTSLTSSPSVARVPASGLVCIPQAVPAWHTSWNSSMPSTRKTRFLKATG